MPTGDLHDFSDDDFLVSNVFDFTNSPDALQTLDTIGSNDQKSFLNPQELLAGPFPGSPTGSIHDSSSDTASSTKRSGSSASTKTPGTIGDMNMDSGADEKMDWGHHNMGAFDEDDSAFTFGRELDSSAMHGLYGFGEHDDTFMEQTFDFESASSSPDAPNGQINMPSPGMPTIKTHSPKKPEPSRSREQGHKKRASQYSVTSSRAGQKREASREPSPMSTMVASHDSSPAAAVFSTPSPHAGSDWSMMNGTNMWANKLSISSPTIPDGMPNPARFAAMAHQMPVFGGLPTYNFTGGYELRILPTPLKSRVETQIPIKMTLSPLPPGVSKLHLPSHTISKPKLMARPPPERSSDTLELFVSLVCTSAMDQSELKKKALERAANTPQGHLPDLDDEENSPQNGGEVRICNGCITRERKRAARKKVKKPDEDKLWSQDEERRVVVFNTQEVKEWQPISGVLDANGRPEPTRHNRVMQIDAPMRIACYCRHHNEKMGFNVIFTIKDWKDQIIAQAMSNPIMITDDHKTNPMTQLTTQPPMSETVTSSSVPMHHPLPMDPSSMLPSAQNGAFGFSPSAAVPLSSQAAFSAATSGKTTPTMTSASVPGRPLSRPPSPSQNGHLAKKRKSSGSRVPNGLTMTRLDTSPTPASQGIASVQVSTATSPFSSGPNPFPQADQLFGQPGAQIPFANGPPTPNSNEVPFFANRRSESMDNLAMAQLYNSAPTSNHASRAPSPNGLRNGVSNVSQTQLAQAIAGGLYSIPMGVNQPRAPPIIHKIIPNEGPKIGGIEVTVLGASFFQGLEVWFGDNKATTTTFWGESSLVCLLPPSPTAGPVPVTFGRQSISSSSFPGKQPPSFKYIDDTEDKLIRTALSVLGHKMSGQMVDVNDLARRILNDGNSSWSGGSSAGPSTGGGGGPVFNHTSHEHLESQLLKVLDLIDLDDSAHRTRLDLKGSTGHTMLHLACTLGYHRFVAALLARGANPDARDRGGFTPLHMAAVHNHPEIVRRLMIAGTDPTIRSLSGLTARDVSQSRAVERTIRSSQRHIRSRSGGSLQSRTSSATSMRSMWEPLTRAHTHEGPLSVDSSEESPEYTSGDFEDEDPDENNYLSMRRPSRLRRDSEVITENSEELDNGAGSNPAAIAAAFKDQIQQQLQQFQQTMALHIQNLAHLPQVGMPQMPTFSGMPMLPDYQAYLPQAQFMRRVQQLVPGMSGNREEPAGDDQPKLDGRWWDISSYKSNTVVPPPAYDDIFPQEDMDKKMQSAARAAVEAEADLKCATLYGEAPTTTTIAATAATTTSTAIATSSRTKEIPKILEIGRKNAITKEQQDNFLRAREQKLKRLSNDRNLFFIWIPLLLIMVCALLYSYFPSLFPILWTSSRAVVQTGYTRVSRVLENIPARVVEV
ncbi:Protein MGA2 [Cladobotryum mycophilum]|uniref:Protein MGA2 n=1 Tax=Cladobotryum mycophilum TaxID=491253 RepID=A0ABR0T0B1_9HYPO